MSCDEDEDDIMNILSSAEAAEKAHVEQKNREEDAELVDLVSAEEYLDANNVELLEYEKAMFLDLVHTDGLVIVAKGITYDRVFVNLLKIFCDPSSLVIVVNCSEADEKLYRSQLDSVHIHESSSNVNERERVYKQGGIQFISTRIFVVDLLKNRIPVDLVTGLFVLRAHDVIESCQVAFALRLFRQKNKTGFIKAFSRNAEAFSFGYGHIEKVMRNIFVKEVFLWPRFHRTIRQTLTPFEPPVIELQVPMTQNMIVLQAQLLDIMNFMVKDIKQLNRTVELEEITVENCVTKKFHKILQAQLDSIWYQLSSRTKLIIADLKVLRSLIIATIYQDAVYLYAMMKKYRTKEYAMSNSGWTILDAAERLFTITRQRVFNKNDEFEPEQCPKWKILLEILRVEIPSDVKEKFKKLKKPAERNEFMNSQIKVLILCQDARTCYQLNQYLTQGPEKYLFYTAMKNDVKVTKLSESYKTLTNSDSDPNAFKIESVDTYFKPVRSFESDKSSDVASTSLSGVVPDKSAKKSKKKNEDDEFGKAEEGEETVNPLDMAAELFAEDEDDNFQFKDSYILTMSQRPLDPNKSAGDESSDEEDSILSSTFMMENGEFETFAELENFDMTAAINKSNKPIVFIQTFKSEMNGFVTLDRTLEEIKPRYIIMYHCNVTAIRQIEVYEARKMRQPQNRVHVYAVLHSKTVEEQSYLTNLRREKQAFELLIETKRTMVVPDYQDGKSDDAITMQRKQELVSTRNAGGQEDNVEFIMPKIIVDMREFRSDLPCLIHKRGIEVVPLTITIGDYILTPSICVERKSISDLIQSLGSGRLYSQCVQMTRYYSKPILLIEFNQNKSFYLQRNFMMTTASPATASNHEIMSKIQLLTIHFPKLKLVWSPSPYATAQLFEELKHNEKDPDPEVAIQIGTDVASDAVENFIDKINPNIYDFLIKLPGINSRNIQKIMTKCKNMKDLMEKTEKELDELLVNKHHAKMLWEILHVAHKPAPLDERPFTSRLKGGKRKF